MKFTTFIQIIAATVFAVFGWLPAQTIEGVGEGFTNLIATGGTPEPTPPCGPWQYKAPYPFGVHDAAVASDGTHVYVFGGQTGGFGHAEVNRYDPRNDTWTPREALTFGNESRFRASYGGNGKIYVMGGINNVRHNRIYDIASNTWSLGADVPIAVNHQAQVALNGKIYVIGGRSGSQTVNSVFVYDVSVNSWAPLAPMPAPRYGAATAVLDGKIYVAGGTSDGFSPVATFYIYDIAANSWSVGPPMTAAIFFASGAALNGKFWVLAGATELASLDTARVFDPSSNTWGLASPLNAARMQSGAATVDTIDGVKILVAGGRLLGSGTSIDSVEMGAPCVTPTPTPTPTPAVAGDLFTFSSNLRAFDGRTQDRFGGGVAVDGDTVVIGSNGADFGPGNPDRGAAYIYVRRGLTWTLQQKIVASDAANFDSFGSRVAISGDTIAVSAHLDDAPGPIENKGAVYVFTRNGTIWTEQQKLVASDGAGGDFFGIALAISGDTIVAGSPNDDFPGADNAGSAYVFTRSEQTWTEQAKLTANDAEGFASFGTSVAIDGDYALVGSPDATSGGGFRTGAAYVFLRTGTSWAQQQKLVSASAEQFDNQRFGISVDIDGDTAIGGAWEESIPGGSDQGTASVFVRSGTTWTLQTKLTAFDMGQNDRFGKDVVIDGDQVVVGAAVDDVGPNSDQGSAYAFSREGTTWTPRGKLVAPDGAANDIFGEDLSLDDGTLFASCANDDSPPNGDVGSAYVFQGATNVPDLQAASDTGLSNADNITNIRDLSFTINDVTVGATVELLRDGAPVSSTVAVGTSVALSDTQAPVNGNIRYRARQTLPSSAVITGAPTVVTIDTTPPSVTINQSVAQADPTRIQPISFTAVTSEPVFGFESSDISLAGSTANVSGASASVAGTGPYSISISGAIGDGQTVVASIPAGGVFDDAGNLMAASSSTDNVVTLDNVAPTVAVNQAIDQTDPSRSQPVRFTATFSESVTGLTPSDISLAGSTADVSSVTLDVAEGPVTYTISVSGIRSSGLVSASIIQGAAQDTLGNVSLTSTSTDNTVMFILKTAVFDFDGDSKTDISIFRPSVGEWWINHSGSGNTVAFQFGASTDKIAPADFTGDGKTDIAFFRPSTGEWYILRSENNSFFSFPFGASEDIPAPADYDADGKADPAVFRPSSATWYIQRSSDNGTTIAQFGATGDHPVAVDYDGDGKADLAIYRPSNGQWWLNRSTAGLIVYQFGEAADKSVQGDYTGDGKADVALWRPSTGEWFILRSEDTTFFSAPFGTNGDIPSPGDYDGDGRFDVTVFRPSDTNWYSQRTTAGTLIQQFGATGDRPVANAFVP
ncbi:MAG TPA: kelch repeat-containing protein [Pyrinomonadaceae bacterium]